MKRTWQTWIAFALCAGVAVAALSWLTIEAVRADLDRSQANHQAELEQKISLVLWRMDTKLAPLIAEEVAKPASFYRNPKLWTFNSPQVEEGSQDSSSESGMATLSEHVILNYMCSSAGGCESPQIPPGAISKDSEQWDEQTKQRAEQFSILQKQINYRDLLARLPAGPLELSEPKNTTRSFDNSFAGNNLSLNKPKKSGGRGFNMDLQRRAERYDYVAQQELRKQRENPNYGSSPLRQQADVPDPEPTPVITGVTHPLWIGENLLLARRVVIDGQTEVQGSWLDWPGIREDLLAEAKEMLPNATLAPVYDVEEADPTRMLAGLPVVITPGEKFVAATLSSPMEGALWIGWLSFLFAIVTAAILLAGVMTLSERRAAFVSSVTHELRTPLTTFRMYSDMLARGMISDNQRRQEYLETLRDEAERLTHLVENVLAYARLERGRKVNRQETVSIGKIVERLEQRLIERATQAKMEFVKEIEDNSDHCLITTDVGVVEQILFNLVDNSCKYAADSEDRRLHWNIGNDSGYVLMTIKDHGPGFISSASARYPRSFSKTSEEAALTAPGVGLGLALCRKLAKQLGGRLDVADSVDGVAATLRLPINGV